jgi:hypothetical protein
LNQGNGTFGPVNLVVNNFGTNQGWKVNQHPVTLPISLVTSEETLSDSVKRGIRLVQQWKWYIPASQARNQISGWQQGWQVSKHPRYVVDLTGDGCADVIGFGENNVYVAYNDGKGGFGPVRTLLSTFSYSDGWAVDKTVRYLANLDQSR